jgi:SAM-dependent methyltransferase
MNSESPDLNSRDYPTYLREFNALPFERILEEFRKRKLLEISANFEWGLSENILEVGPGYNSICSDIFPDSKKIILEPSIELYQHNRKIIPKDLRTDIFNLDIKSYSRLHNRLDFDIVFLSSVLHEFTDPITEMQILIRMIKSGGHLVIVVPNNESIHRQFGVTMGILKSTSSQTSTEKIMQQNNNYSIESLTTFVNLFNLDVAYFDTSFVKPHTHSQMQNWSDLGEINKEDLEYLYSLSPLFHPFNAEIFMIVTKK